MKYKHLAMILLGVVATAFVTVIVGTVGFKGLIEILGIFTLSIIVGTIVSWAVFNLDNEKGIK
jgi:hypothetical protein